MRVTSKGDNMLKRIKYTLLRWLLDDICLKSSCKDCRLQHETNFCGTPCYDCLENDIFVQARKVWGLEDC